MSCIRFDWQESPFETGDLSYISIHILCINSMYRHIFDICCSPRKWSVHRWKLISNQHLLVYHHVPSVQIPKIVLLVIHPITSPIENHIKNIKLLVWHSLTRFFWLNPNFCRSNHFFVPFIPICQLPAAQAAGAPQPAVKYLPRSVPAVPAPGGPGGTGGRGGAGPQVAPKAGLEITNGAMILHGDLSKFGKTKASQEKHGISVSGFQRWVSHGFCSNMFGPIWEKGMYWLVKLALSCKTWIAVGGNRGHLQIF